MTKWTASPHVLGYVMSKVGACHCAGQRWQEPKVQDEI